MIGTLLSRLDKVHRSSKETWSARCPAHDDRGPSLSVRECQDGTILIHCHAGCSPEAVASAVGIDLADLFPKDGNGKPIRSPYPASDVLKCVAKEAVIVLMVARAVADGKTPAEDDMKRLVTAVARLNDALETVRGNLR